MNVVVADGDLARQVSEAIRFLRRHQRELARLRRYRGLESVGLDFGVTNQRIFVQTFHLPLELLRLAGALGFDIEVSCYGLIADELMS